MNSPIKNPAFGDAVQIIESCFDTFQFERAFIVRAAEYCGAHAFISGIECNITTKPTLLAHGLAFCQPTDATLALNWPVYTDVVCNGVADRWWNITSNADVVKAASELSAAVAMARSLNL